MTEAIVRFALGAYAFLLRPAELVFVLCVIVGVPLALIRKTRRISGLAWFLSSWLFGLTVWVFSSGVSLAVYGWVGLIIGWLFVGLGVVPIAIFGAFFSMDNAAVGWQLVGMAVVTLVARYGGMALTEAGEDSAGT